MILIADSGATKTDWMLLSGNSRTIIQTGGINPFHQTKEEIESVVFKELMPKLEDTDTEKILHIFFYGAGCVPEPSTVVQDILQEAFLRAETEIYTDLMGAARALCKDQPGIACILGTGANSCEYNGKEITSNVSPLGYILGDEGSGAYIGKRFIGDCLKNQLPTHLKEGLLNEYGLTPKDILDKVYREPMANRFLASITPYIYKHKSEKETNAFLKDCFREFFNRNLNSYKKDLKVSFTGSIAWFFQEEIKETATESGYTTGIFIKSPINGLADFHTL